MEIEYTICDNGMPLKRFATWRGVDEREMTDIMRGIAVGLRLAGRKRVRLELWRNETTEAGTDSALVTTQC